MHIKEIQLLLKEKEISLGDFQRSLGSFLFMFDNRGKMIINDSDVHNTITRILTDRHMKNNTSPVKYLRLLSYDNAVKVINFICNNDKEDYAHITTGGVAMQVKDENYDKVLEYIISLGVRYEIGSEHPTKVVEKIVSNLKAEGVIK